MTNGAGTCFVCYCLCLPAKAQHVYVSIVKLTCLVVGCTFQEVTLEVDR